MPQQNYKSALDLARALNRYNRMRRPENAYDALHDEWPPQIASLIDKVLWSSTPLDGSRTLMEIACEHKALLDKAVRDGAAIQAHKRKHAKQRAARKRVA